MPTWRKGGPGRAGAEHPIPHPMVGPNVEARRAANPLWARVIFTPTSTTTTNACPCPGTARAGPGREARAAAAEARTALEVATARPAQNQEGR
jgi:hypothetical protein